MNAQRLATGGLLLALGVGCSSGDKWTKDLPETVEASGVVLLDGKPVDGATIVFAPADGGKYAANALSDSGGRFEARAFPSKEGAVPGKYTVMIQKTVEQKGGAPPKGPDAAHAPPPEENVTWVNVLPQKYATPTTSGLTAEIPPGGTRELKFELKK